VTPRDRALALLRELALTGGAVVGTLCLVFTLLSSTIGVRPLVFTSGSMAPTINTGDVAITRPVELARLAPGDVVSVFDARGERITHRVVEVDAARHLLRLKGDANDVADPLPYAADRADLVLFSVPAGGYVLTWLSSPPATMLLGAYLAFLGWVLWPRGSGARRATSTAAGLVLVVGFAAGLAPTPQPTSAAWTDAVPIGGVSLAAYTVPKPVITNCTATPALAQSAITVTWTAVSSPYALTYRAVVVQSGQVLTVTGTGSTRSARYPTAQLNLNGTQTIQITAALPGTPSWTSVPATQTVGIALLGLLPSCGASS
jgi:signal peptidase I